MPSNQTAEPKNAKERAGETDEFAELTRPELTKAAPWPGLAHYTSEESEFFFGRDAEITEIEQRVRDNPLTILYGQSGLGKTSLLSAGLLPRLDGDTLRVEIIRLRFEGREKSLLDQTREALGLPGESGDASELTLWEHFHLRERREVGQQLPVLIFDQFEEIFTLGGEDAALRNEREEWLTEVSDLVQNRPPERLAQQLRQDRQAARKYDFAAENPRVVFSLREDYLSHLEEWVSRMPLLMQNRMALNPLRGIQAVEAIQGPADLSDPPLVSNEVAMRIVRAAAGAGRDRPLGEITVAPPILSLMAEQLNEARLDNGADRISGDLVSTSAENILKTYYEDCFKSFPENESESIRALIEDRLLTVSGHRTTIAEDDMKSELEKSGVSDIGFVLRRLMQRRLIVREPRPHPIFEITHDVLLPVMLVSRENRRRRWERAKSRRAIVRAIVAFCVLAVVAISGWWVGYSEMKEANRLLEELNAQKERERQEVQKKLTDTMRDRLDRSFSKKLMGDSSFEFQRESEIHRSTNGDARKEPDSPPEKDPADESSR